MAVHRRTLHKSRLETRQPAGCHKHPLYQSLGGEASASDRALFVRPEPVLDRSSLIRLPVFRAHLQDSPFHSVPCNPHHRPRSEYAIPTQVAPPPAPSSTIGFRSLLKCCSRQFLTTTVPNVLSICPDPFLHASLTGSSMTANVIGHTN